MKFNQYHFIYKLPMHWCSSTLTEQGTDQYLQPVLTLRNTHTVKRASVPKARFSFSQL